MDVETLHVDVCASLPLFGDHPATPNAEAAAQVVQLPVYASLSDRNAKRVAKKVRKLLGPTGQGRKISAATTDPHRATR